MNQSQGGKSRNKGTVSSNLNFLVPSVTMSISQEAQRLKSVGEDVVDLSAGEPDFATPRNASEAGIRAIQQGKTHYPPNAGILELRAAAAQNLSLLSGGRAVNADCIVISSGAKQSLFNACFSLFGPGDSVLIPTPAWVSYPQMVHFSGARPVDVPGDVEWSLKVGVDQLNKAADDTTRGLILCSPVNPTGAVYTLTELKTIAEWANENDVWLIADEIYRCIHYGEGTAPSVLDLPDELLEKVVLIYGASKAYAMTGWRIGITLAPRLVVNAISAFQSHTTSGASQPAQWAAATALSDRKVETDMHKMVKEFGKRRDMVVEFFRNRLQGVEFVEPMGAFYLFFRVDQFFVNKEDTALGFCEELMAEEALALVPGDAFGDKRWVRLSFAAAEKEIKKGLERLERFIDGSRRKKVDHV